MTELTSISGHWRGEVSSITGESSLKISEERNGNLIGTYMNGDRGPISEITGQYHKPTVIMRFKFYEFNVQLEGKLNETNDRIEGVVKGITVEDGEFFFDKTE